MYKMACLTIATLFLSACASTPNTAVRGDTRGDTCLYTDNTQFWERETDSQVVVRSGARYYRVNVEPSCSLPERIHSVSITDRAAPIRYVRGPQGQMVPAVQRSSSRVCAHQRPTMVVFDSPIMWTVGVPRQCRITSIERVERVR